MTQDERRIYLIQELVKEEPQYKEIAIPKGAAEQKRLLRALFNVRMPRPVNSEWAAISPESSNTPSGR